MGTGQLETYRVSGDSMNPLLHDGQEVRVQPMKIYEVGDIVVAIHPIQTDITIIKRIVGIESGRFRLSGDNVAQSTDKFGLVSHEKIIGKVVSVYPKLD